jgi:hypothetical protein
MVLDQAASTSRRCSIAPWLSVRNSARAVEFDKSAFGATELFRLEDPDGGVVARLSVDGGEFWLSDESPKHGNFSPHSLGGGSVRMILSSRSRCCFRESHRGWSFGGQSDWGGTRLASGAHS